MDISFRYKNDERKDNVSMDENKKRPFTAEETIACLIERCLTSLDEMRDCEEGGEELSDYAGGMKSVYAEILQVLQKWEKCNEYGLGIDIERVYFRD